METSEQINEISSAVSKLQASMKGAQKDSVNPFFKTSYANLESVWAAIREPLGAHGLSIFQDIQTKEGCVGVITRIAHASGQWIQFGPFEVPFGKRDAQSVGAACSYAKRYSLCAALGIVSTSEDDDAESTMVRDEEEAKPVTTLSTQFWSSIPSDFPKEKIVQFVQERSNAMKCAPADIMKSAIPMMEKFLNAFKIWESKK